MPVSESTSKYENCVGSAAKQLTRQFLKPKSKAWDEQQQMHSWSSEVTAHTGHVWPALQWVCVLYVNCWQ